MLHQWHPLKHRALDKVADIEQARHYWVHNHELVRARASQAQRNPQGWGDASQHYSSTVR
jgi:hypothetical protein